VPQPHLTLISVILLIIVVVVRLGRADEVRAMLVRVCLNAVRIRLQSPFSTYYAGLARMGQVRKCSGALANVER
jgi:hypothetical protein